MWVIARAVTYATVFISFFFVLLPARVLERAGIARPEAFGAAQAAGIALVVVGGAIALWCVAAFATLGRGTPAPFDPPRRLVVRGPYRYVRNPMYIGGGLTMLGASLAYESWALLSYYMVFMAAAHVFVVIYEEPTLGRLFGEEYDAYRRRVRRWLPRLTGQIG